MSARFDDREKQSVQLLEGRRLSVDAIMWQTPTILVLAQTFLLQIITDPQVNRITA